MKEAAGEANMTVITIVLIAIVLGVGALIVRAVVNSSRQSSCCVSNGGVWKDGACWATCSGDGVETCSGSISTICTES